MKIYFSLTNVLAGTFDQPFLDIPRIKSILTATLGPFDMPITLGALDSAQAEPSRQGGFAVCQ